MNDKNTKLILKLLPFQCNMENSLLFITTSNNQTQCDKNATNDGNKKKRKKKKRRNADVSAFYHALPISGNKDSQQ